MKRCFCRLARTLDWLLMFFFLVFFVNIEKHSWLYFKMHEINVEPRNTANEKKIDKMLVQCNWIIMVFRASGTKCLVAHTKSNLTVPIEYFSGLSIFWVNLGLKICQLQGKWSYIQAKWTWNSPPSQPPQEMKSLQQEMVISKSLNCQLTAAVNFQSNSWWDNKNAALGLAGTSLSIYTPWKIEMSPENECLEDQISSEKMVPFFGKHVDFRGVK